MKLNGVREYDVVVNGIKTHYYEAGQGEIPVVLLHGSGVDSAMISWKTILPGLSTHYRVIAPDLPGYGKTDKPDVDYSMVFYQNYLGDFLRVLHFERVILAGLSLGGGVSLGYTLLHPENIEKLILVDSYGILSYMSYHKLTYLYIHSPLNEFSYWLIKQYPQLIRLTLGALIYDPKNITDELVEEFYQVMKDPALGKAFNKFQRSECLWNGLRSDYTNRFSEINTPTLILNGDHDDSVPAVWAEKAHAAIRNSQFVLLKNRRHWALRDNPQEIIDIILGFLAG
jgi:pimeloyl-ACP methyl ester carboxylesterase